jgi:type I restriction enzyme M protein
MMKELKIEEIMPLEAVKSKIWIMFNILRSENISSDDYHVVLFLLSAYKDNLISIDLVNENQHLKEKLIEQLRNSNNEFYEQYAPILQSFEPSIQRLSENGLKHFFSVLIEINKQVLTENFPDVFDSVLYRISQSQGRYAGEFIQPVELTRFMCGLADLKKDAKVFNPFSGIASFNIFLNQDQNYFGQELNQKTWAIGKLRLLAYGRIENSRYDNDDSIYNWPNKSNKFDLIISFPPIGLNIRSNNIRGKFIHTYSRVEQLLIERSIENLTPSGKVITIVPLSFLQRSNGEEHILSNLIDNDLIETIISLPGGLLANTGIPIAILTLNKAKKMPGKVKFVDAKQFVISKGIREKVLDDYALDRYIRSHKEDDSIIRFVDNVQIRNNDYNLSVPRYFRKEIDGVKLGDILELVRGQRGNLPETGKLIRIRDLKDDKVDFTLDISSVEATELRRPNIHLVSESCLLLAMRWRTLKPTLFEFKGDPIFKGLDILSFKVNESLVDKAYLINELHADYVLEQIERFQTGAVAPSLKKDDLLEIRIKLPSLNEQKAKVQGASIAYEASKFKEAKLEKEISFIKAKFNEELREKQHCIRQHLKNVVDSISVINTFMDRQNGTISKDDVINPIRNITVAQRLTALNNSLKSLSLEIDNLTNDELYDKSEILEIRDIIRECILELGDAKGFLVQESFDDFALEEFGNSNPGISISKRSFKELFNNIVMNAKLHGFIKEDKEYLIKVIVTIEEDKLKLSIVNDGKPFAEGISKQLGVKGKKAGSNAGSGIGVWKVFEIAKQYNFECKIIDLPGDEFPVGWEFKFGIAEK